MRAIHDFRPFVPSNDYEISKAFYQRIGFTVNWDRGEICEIDTNFGFRFLLQSKNHDNYARSLMLHFTVNSAQEWYGHLESLQLSDAFPGTKVAPPELMPWGLVVAYAWDPAGVLLHFAEKPNPDTTR